MFRARAALSGSLKNARSTQFHRQMYPSVDFTAQYGVGDWDQPGNKYWVTGLVFSVPLFNGLSDLSGYRQQIATAGQADVKLQTLLRQAAEDVRSLSKKNSRRFARLREGARSDAAKKLEKISEDSIERFRIGRMTVNELTIDQDRTLNLRSS